MANLDSQPEQWDLGYLTALLHTHFFTAQTTSRLPHYLRHCVTGTDSSIEKHGILVGSHLVVFVSCCSEGVCCCCVHGRCVLVQGKGVRARGVPAGKRGALLHLRGGGGADNVGVKCEMQ